MSDISVNFDRLQEDLDELSTIGRAEEDHGVYRMAFNDAYMESREWLKGRLDDAGLDVHEDEALNVHGRLGWDRESPSVMTGSHIDTVPGAGHLDGALGVVTALECLRRLKELDVKLARPVELVNFTDEEGRFGGMFGSQAMAGLLTPELILGAKDLDGNRLVDALSERGHDALKALRATRRPESIHSFVELHIEQGPVLDRNQKPLGVVEGIVGLFKWQVRFLGTANHAGTTPMDMRNDAFQGLAETAVATQRILDENGSGRSVATIGRVELFPGAANVVPGKAEFTLEVRDIDKVVLDRLGDAFRRSMSATARRHGLMFEFDVLSEFEPVHCDDGIVGTIESVARDAEIPSLRLPSGAAHDTQMMANIARVGMVFVPSKEGRSHSAAEWTDWKDIETGANVLLRTLYRLAS